MIFYNRWYIRYIRKITIFTALFKHKAFFAIRAFYDFRFSFNRREADFAGIVIANILSSNVPVSLF